MSKVKVPMSAAVRSTTLTVVVTGVRRTRFRLWLGSLIVRAAASVIGCQVDVSIKAAD